MSEKIMKGQYIYTKSNGRMVYTPEFHTKHNKPWKVEELSYLCGMYKKESLKNIALSLGRTYGSVLTKIYNCRKDNSLKTFKAIFDKE